MEQSPLIRVKPAVDSCEVGERDAPASPTVSIDLISQSNSLICLLQAVDCFPNVGPCVCVTL
jgi:hypothetical protein